MNAKTKQQYEQLKQRMLQDKARLEQQLSDPDSVSGESLRDSTGELSAADNHPADTGTEVFERGRDLAIEESQHMELEQINAALARMERGEYGHCTVCGQEIPLQRLEAVPYTAYCIDHAPNRALSDDRPVEEDVMTAPPSGAGINRQRMSGRFDDADAWDAVNDYGTSTSPAMSVKPGQDDYKN
ncbi:MULTISPECIES: TraR/DksA C4-type zinc finger protein [Paenibacillus]|jgi:YteA family regulatory protein|uniref:Transcriptional regulator, TraR/DksA family n=2 Tax=Paenibacillus lactis TaxID=228574 RepID=G4HBA5_9BACL|nr:TraR/DksA C4-type zinc finger protein [Paenibacillus lactis]EHB67214.1 transcriptional regulator, TraR/DksA family [Paenibacillus lactis 154]MBP1894469.1 YteA family regulatory protein [Paenibacillus lactis]HAF98680.1 conjugal transfer protein TraR [Paenibacillus lactis]